MTSVRKLEAHAIRALVNLHDPDTGPHEWGPEHWDEAEAAASMLSGLLRRHEAAADRARARRAAQAVKPRVRRSEPIELTRSRRIVAERSGGRCEHPSGCVATAQVVHHRAGRVGPGVHRPEMLLHLCDDHHRWVHDHPVESYENGSMIRRNGVI